LFHILRPELGACAEVGVHGSLAIWRHEDHGARGGRKIAKRSRIECYALRANIMAVDIAELVLCDLSEIGGAPAQASQAGSRVPGTSARRFNRRPHAIVEEGCAFGIDQVHRTLDDAVIDQKRLVAPGNDIDNGIADAKDVVFAHALLQFVRQNARWLSRPGLEQFVAKWKRRVGTSLQAGNHVPISREMQLAEGASR